MLAEIYIEALLVDEDLADQVRGFVYDVESGQLREVT